MYTLRSEYSGPSMKFTVQSRIEDIKIIKKKEYAISHGIIFRSRHRRCGFVLRSTRSTATWIVRPPSSNEWNIKNRFCGLVSKHKYFMILSHFDRFFSFSLYHRHISAHNNLSLRFLAFKMCCDNRKHNIYSRIIQFPLYPVRWNHHVLLRLFIAPNSVVGIECFNQSSRKWDTFDVQGNIYKKNINHGLEASIQFPIRLTQSENGHQPPLLHTQIGPANKKVPYSLDT